VRQRGIRDALHASLRAGGAGSGDQWLSELSVARSLGVVRRGGRRRQRGRTARLRTWQQKQKQQEEEEAGDGDEGKACEASA